MTIAAFITMLAYKNWKLSRVIHSFIGLVFTIVALLLVLGGIFAWIIRRKSPSWGTNKMLK